MNDVSASLKNIGQAGPQAIAAAAASIAAMTVRATENNKALERGAYVAGLLTSEYQAMALASKSVGVDMGQIESILGDTEEKIGEFINAGSGGFQDFADAMGMTKEQARNTAISLQNLSGRDVLVEMVKQMEAANLTAEQMNNALESMGSDARYLLPLLKDGATELKNLEGRFGALATTLDKDTTAKLNELNTVVGIAASNMQNSLASAIASISTELVFAAENTAFFYASLQAGTIQNVTSNMARVSDQIKNTRLELEQMRAGDGGALISLADSIGLSSLEEQIGKREKILSDLESRYESLQAEYKSMAGLELPDKPTKNILTPESPAATGTNANITGGADTMSAQIEALKQSYMTQEELAVQKLNKDLELINAATLAEQEAITLRELAYEAYYEKLDEMDATRLAKVKSQAEKEARAEEKAAKDKERFDKEQQDAKLDLMGATSNALASILGRDSAAYKAAATTEAIISTYLAANKALANPGGPAGIALAGVAVATGMANVAQIQSARFNGGDVNAGSGYKWQERDGEAFIPKVDGRVYSKNDMKDIMSGGGQGVTLVNNIYNQTDANVISKPNAQGGEDIYITRDEFPSLMANEVSNPNSDFNQAFPNTWSASRS
ncbi:MAG: hypothetical protein GY774_20680 [Planctomycetes bacterium]|nr:hypothetical protein [Planctomycetota bacterium]